MHHRATLRLFIILAVLVLIGTAGLFVLAYGIPTAPRLPATPNVATSSEPAVTTAPSVPLKPTVPVVLDTSVTITNADNNSTVHMAKGSTFVVQIGNGLKWSGITFDPASSITQLAGISGAEQGTFKAVVPGTVTLKATGAPICKAGQPCPMFLAVFSTTLVIR